MPYYISMKELQELAIKNQLEIVRVWNENKYIVVEFSNGVRFKIPNY